MTGRDTAEARFRALVEHSSTAIVLLDRAGTVLYTSQPTPSILGYAAGDNVGQVVFDLIHPDDRPALETRFAEVAAAAGRVEATEFRARHKDGSWRDIEGIFANRLDDPAVGAVVLNYHDNTDRRRGEADLKAALSLLTATLESTADGILVVDRDGRVASHNSKFARMWRVPDEVLESRDAARLHAYVSEQLEDPESYLAKLRRLVDRPEAESFDVLPFRDGRVFERFSQPQRIGGTVVGRVWSFRDVTDQTRGERVQRATYRIAEAANTARDLPALLARIHEIVNELMPARNFYIAVYDSASEQLSFPYFVDEFDTADAPRKRRKGLTEYVLRTGQPLLVTPEVHQMLERRGDVELIGAPSLDWLGVPLKANQRTIGVLVVQTYTAGVRFGETEQHILQFVSTQVARAIERKRADEQLQASERKYRLLFDSNPEPMWVSDRETLRFLAVNQAAVNRYGYSQEEFLTMTTADIRAPAEPGRAAAGVVPPTTLPSYAREAHRRKDGSVLDVEVAADEIEFGGRPAYLTLARDLTERRHLEDQLRQSQKMEAVGRLAGGIAHDFNNLLTAILGNCQLLERQLTAPEQEMLRQDVVEVRRAGERAASLTQQLLAFSRKQVLRAIAVDVNVVVADIDKMLRRMIGEDIDLVTVLRSGVAPVKADPNQLEQVVLNLAINARDAMPHGGRLTIETANIELDDSYARQHLPATPGHYVLLAVSDTGHGMDEETKAHLFEPFFTTKGVGKGTGLGLATVYGIVKQFAGYIWVYSERGHGTTFKIYLPQAEGAREPAAPPAPAPRGGSETVLLVEDEEAVRTLAQKVLRARGYTVLEAGTGHEALAFRERHKGPIDLLLTDVIMPGMNGRELAEELAPSYRGIRVLYMSGYTDDAVLRHGVLEEGTAYIQKPFTPDALAQRVRDVLDE